MGTLKHILWEMTGSELFKPDRYDPRGTSRWWVRASAKEDFYIQTVGHFGATCRFMAGLERVDLDAFRDARMLDKGAKKACLRQFFLQRIKPLLVDKKAVLAFVMSPAPDLGWYFRNEAGEYEYDAGGSKFAQYINEQNYPAINGCKCTVAVLQQHTELFQVRDNYRMLSDEHIVTALADEKYARSIQASTVAAMQDRIEIEQEYQRIKKTDRVSGRCFSITYELDGQDVILRWEVHDGEHGFKPGYRIIGKRKTGGFDSANPKTLVVDSRGGGKSVDRPGAGETYYYTFTAEYDRTTFFGGKTDIYIAGQKLNFSVNVPSDADRLSKLEYAKSIKLLERDIERISGSVKGKRERLAKMFQDNLDALKSLYQLREENLLAVERLAGISNDERDFLIRKINDMFEVLSDAPYELDRDNE